MPEGKFTLVSSFETLEHTPDPMATIGEICTLVDEPGIVMFSTLIQPADFTGQGLNWWYVGPRNGHISLFSRKSLTEVWRRHGFTIGSFDNNQHIAFRNVPDFAKHLIGQS